MQQIATGRYLEAYDSADDDFQAVTREERFGDPRQLWRIVDV